MNKIFKSTISCVLAICLILTPVASVEAESFSTSGSCGTSLSWTLNESGVLTISGTGPMYDFGNSQHPYTPWTISNVKEVVVNAGVTSVGNQAFVEATNLTSVYLPNGLYTIGDSAFAGCSNLQSISIGTGLTTVGTSAFLMCTSLQSINLPNTVSSIGKQAFLQCKSLTSFTIPSGVTTIGESTFYMCTKLNSIALPNSVKTITGTYAFGGCTNLKTISFGTGLTSIGEGAFYNCKGLTSLNIPSNVKTIGKIAFAGCNNIKSLTLNEGLVSIGEEAFYVDEFNSVTIPSTVTSIGKDAFAMGGYKTLYGNKGSIAESYAKNYNYLTFVAVGSTPGTDPEELEKEQEKQKEPKETQIQLELGRKYSGTVDEMTSCLYTINIPCDCKLYASTISRTGESPIKIDYLNSSKTRIGGFTFSSTWMSNGSSGSYSCSVKKGTYYIRISGIKAGYEIAFDIDSIIVPTGLKLTGMTNNTISIQWDKVDNVSGYEVTYNYSYWDDPDSKNSELIRVERTLAFEGADKTTCTIGGISEDQSTTFKVCSICKIGNITKKSKLSSYVVGYTAHNAPKLKKLVAGKKKLTVKWKPVYGRTCKMKIQYSTKKSMKSAKTVTAPMTNSSKVIKKLKSKKKYYVRMQLIGKCNNVDCNSPWSRTLSVRAK